MTERDQESESNAGRAISASAPNAEMLAVPSLLPGALQHSDRPSASL